MVSKVTQQTFTHLNLMIFFKNIEIFSHQSKVMFDIQHSLKWFRVVRPNNIPTQSARSLIITKSKMLTVEPLWNRFTTYTRFFLFYGVSSNSLFQCFQCIRTFCFANKSWYKLFPQQTQQNSSTNSPII